MVRGEFERISTLSMHLPPQSRIYVKMNPELQWDEKAYLLALLVDNVAGLCYGLGDGKGRKPKPVPRPKAKQKQKHLDVSMEKRKSLLFDRRKPLEGMDETEDETQ